MRTLHILMLITPLSLAVAQDGDDAETAGPPPMHEDLTSLDSDAIDAVVLEDTALTDADREALETIANRLVASIEEARVAVSKSDVNLERKTDAVTQDARERKTARLELRAAKAATKAHSAGASGGDDTEVADELEAAERALDKATHDLGVAKAELGLAKAQVKHAKGQLDEQGAKLLEARARLDGAEEKTFNKLRRARQKAEGREAKVSAKVSIEKVKVAKAKQK